MKGNDYMRRSDKTVLFNNQHVRYGNYKYNSDVCVFDFGDGELKDFCGDDYFVHLEYYPDKNVWIEEIWWEDECLPFGTWTGTTVQLRHDLDEIENFIEKELIKRRIII